MHLLGLFRGGNLFWGGGTKDKRMSDMLWCCLSGALKL